MTALYEELGKIGKKCEKVGCTQGRIQGGSDGGGRSPLGKFDAPQNNVFHLKIRAVFSLMFSEKCHITIFARSHRSERPNRGN